MLKAAPIQGPENPHVRVGRIIAELMGFLLLTPFMVLATTSIVLPVATGLGGVAMTDAYMGLLARAQSFERTCAMVAAPRLQLGDRVILEQAWNYHAGVSAARALLPGAKQGFFLDDRMSDATRGGEAAVARLVEQAGERGGNPVLAGIDAQAHAWVQDRFFPVLRITLVIAVARGYVWLELLLLALLAAPSLWWYGGYVARRRDEAGVQPLGHRYRWYGKGALWLCATSVAVVVLPLPLPAAIILPLLFLLMALLVAAARGQAVVDL